MVPHVAVGCGIRPLLPPSALVLHDQSRQRSAARRPVSSTAVSSWPAGKLFLGARLASTSSLQVNALALAGYAGLTVNAINMIPLGELDGGRVAFGLWGRRCGLSKLAVASCLDESVTEGELQLGAGGTTTGRCLSGRHWPPGAQCSSCLAHFSCEDQL